MPRGISGFIVLCARSRPGPLKAHRKGRFIEKKGVNVAQIFLEKL